MRIFLPLLLGLALSACAVAPRPSPAPVATVAPPPPPAPPPPAPDWRDRPFTQGIWALARDGGDSIAQFGRPGTAPDFLIRCMAATNHVYLSRAGAPAQGRSAAIRLSSTETSKSYSAAVGASVPPYVWTETPGSDPQLDLLSFSRGRILVSVAGMEDLVLPSWPEFARVVEDCRGEKKPVFPAIPQPSQSDAKIN